MPTQQNEWPNKLPIERSNKWLRQESDTVFTTLALLPNGESHSLQAPAGWRLMEVLRDYGLPIRAECGGACSCATCHVHIAGTGRAPLHAPADDELDRLAEIFDADDSSRLACQILTGPQTDGLAVRLAVDSLQETRP
jgi:2Fe-2S ferredoxin